MDDSWIPVWLELRQQAGLHGGQPFPMLPSPQLGGGWARMPLTVSAAADWLRSLLKVESSARGSPGNTLLQGDYAVDGSQVWIGPWNTKVAWIPQ